MKTTAIHVKGFDCDFKVEVVSNTYLNKKQAQVYVKRQIVDTAYVIDIKHIKDGKKR